MTKYEQFHVTICTILISLILPAIVLAVVTKIESFPTEKYLAEHKQLLEDWTTQPYVDIKLEDTAAGCPIDYEPLFTRKWNGTKDVCVEGLSFKPYVSEDGCRGDIIRGIPPVDMTSITGKIACGKRGGPTFLESIRVDPETEECPRTYVPCSAITEADDTVCVKEYEV